MRKDERYLKAVVALTSEYSRAAINGLSTKEFYDVDPDELIVQSMRLAEALMMHTERYLNKHEVPPHEAAH